jgi:FKBP-type peptidyl-prolyl cis-trans isomerase
MPQKNMYIAVVVAIVVVAIFIFLGFFGVNGNQQQAATAPTSAQELLNDIAKTGSVSELKVVDTVVGAGEVIKPGDALEVRYTGVLPDGTVFDATNLHGGTPLSLVVAPDGSLQTKDGGGLISGWSLGFAGMRYGGTRLIAIPSQLGYGERAIGKIPANSTLIFQVEILLPGAPVTAPAAPQQ